MLQCYLSRLCAYSRFIYLELLIFLIEVHSLLVHESNPIERKRSGDAPGTSPVVPHVALSLDHTIELQREGTQVVVRDVYGVAQDFQPHHAKAYIATA